MAVVTIRDLRKSFGSVEVLHGVSIDIAEGEFVVLVGPSGCGKSTLLRMLAGLEHVTSGEILIGDRVVNDLPPKDRDIAMVFQNYALYPHLTVADNMAFSLTLKNALEGRDRRRGSSRRPRSSGSPTCSTATRASSRAASASASPWAARSCATRRSSCSTSRCRTSTPSCASSMRAEIKNLHQRLKTTTVYVTHDQIEAMTMADKIVVMHDGRVEQVGAPLDLYDRPDNLFVAGFIGSPAMNMLTGRIDAAMARASSPATGIALPVGRPLAAAPEGAGRLRPAPGIACISAATCRFGSTWSSRPGRRRTFSADIGATEVVGVFRERVRAAARRGDPRLDRSGGDASLRRRDRAHAYRPEGARLRGRRPFGQIQSRDKEVLSHEQHHPQRPDGRRRRPRRRRRRSACRAPSPRTCRPTPPRTARGCACCAGCRSSRARRRPGTPTPQAFTEATGVEVRIDQESWEDVRPKAAVAANVGSGPDMVMSWFDDPFQYPDKLVDVTELAEAVGAANGGWYDGPKGYAVRDGQFIAMPLCAIGNAICYRQSHMEAAGFTEFPTDSAGFLELCKALQANGTPAGFPHGKAVGDGNNYAHWLLWSHGGKMINEDGTVGIDSAETRAAIEYAKELYATFIPGTESWLDINNNRAFLAGQVSLTANGVSLYYAAMNDPAMAEIAEDIRTTNLPIGPVGKSVELHQTTSISIFNHTQVPGGGDGLPAVHVRGGADERLDRGGERLLLRRRSRTSRTTRSGPRTRSTRPTPRPSASLRPNGYAGPLGYASAGVMADYVLVDMFAQAVTGQASTDDAIANAAKRANRYYS